MRWWKQDARNPASSQRIITLAGGISGSGTRWSDFQIKCHIRQLEELEYLYSIAGKKGKEYVYELLYPGGGEDGKPFLMGLTSIEQLKRKVSDQQSAISDQHKEAHDRTKTRKDSTLRSE